ncbi:MAG TPA: XdhC family protein [Streptosporangiaceae bacterium]|nr:XdhC family protein [Streptosporangiaceae bacterium]
MTSSHSAGSDPACEVAHGHVPAPANTQVLIAVFSSPVAEYLLRFGGDAGFAAVLVEPDERLAKAARDGGATVASAGKELTVLSEVPANLDETADVVVTDHHRPELGIVLRDALAGQARWIGVMGKPGIPPPHIPALTALGVGPAEIARVHRPIGLNIGSRTPPEIAIATMAGLIADRNGRPGGFF